ncbi:MAG: serine hydrolase [Bacteroidetes bacterium]|nr:MAG: serine hydrolase [Bacteroidota bacterium]
MNLLKSKISSFAFLLLIQLSVFSQVSVKLPRSSPEAQGVSSKSIVDFLDAAALGRTEFHSIMIVRHGKVIAEGWWNPYRTDLKHTLYSCSKSFTATAVGFAIQEKKLSLDDKVISFFPKEKPDSVSQFLSELTVKDVLIMSDGMEPDPSGVVAGLDTNWIKGFLRVPIKYEPGTRFLYNSLGTYMLSAIVQKVTKQKVVDYLKPRLFDPLGIKGADWETDLQGINTGGWGLRVKTEDMAKFAQLFLQKGKWNGKQILPESWVADASTAHIMQDPSAPQSKKDSSDWLQGYGYQMWRCRNNAYRGDGAFGQFMIVMPDQDAVIAITAETPSMQEEINLVWQYILPAFQNGSLPEDKTALKNLQDKLKSLALPVAEKTDGVGQKNSGKIYNLGSNALHLQTMSFNFSNGICTVNFKTDKGAYPIKFASGKWLAAETSMPGPSLTAGALENRSMLFPAKITGSYSWKDANTLQLILRYVESPHTAYFTVSFNEDKISVEESNSFDYGKKKITIEGNSK